VTGFCRGKGAGKGYGQVQQVGFGGEAKGEGQENKGRKLAETKYVVRTHSPSASTFLA